MRVLVAAALVAGCSAAPEGVPLTCDASNWRDLIGQPEEALYGAYANLRVIRAGTPVTQDHNPNRLNAEIGSDGRIRAFGCY